MPACTTMRRSRRQMRSEATVLGGDRALVCHVPTSTVFGQSALRSSASKLDFLKRGVADCSRIEPDERFAQCRSDQRDAIEKVKSRLTDPRRLAPRPDDAGDTPSTWNSSIRRRTGA